MSAHPSLFDEPGDSGPPHPAASGDPVEAAERHLQHEARSQAAALALAAAGPDDPSAPGDVPSAGRLLLIDGYAVLYRAFYAMIAKPLRSSRGENTSATWGVAHLLWRHVVEAGRTGRRFDAVAWVMDAGRSGRMEIYPAYKATREKLADELRAEFEQSVARTRELLQAFGVRELRFHGYEADDVIGTVASQAARAGWDVCILSGDKDFHQLVGRRIHLLNPDRRGMAAAEERLVTLENAHERLGVPPHQVVDFLALLGDTSDNVPGVKGIGEKTAQELLKEYGTLERILEVGPTLPSKRAREALVAFADNARLSRRLVAIQRDVPGAVEVDPSDLRPVALDLPRLAAVVRACEFTSLLGRWGLERVTPSADGAARFAPLGDDADDMVPEPDVAPSDEGAAQPPEGGVPPWAPPPGSDPDDPFRDVPLPF